MEIFLDSFELKHIGKYQSFLKGITTNPSIIEKFEKVDNFFEAVDNFKKIFPNLLINLQVTAENADEMIKQAKIIASYGSNFIVKIPSNFEGLKALKVISRMGLKTNATLCFSLIQAQLAQDAGATYISPFIGRMHDFEIDIKEFLLDLRKIMSSTKILAASIRSVEHVELAIKTRCDAITISEKIFAEFFENKLLTKGELLFKEAVKFDIF